MSDGRAIPLDRLPCGWLSMDVQGKVTAVNVALCRMLGADAQSLVGRSFDSLLTRPSRVLFQSYLQPLLRMHGSVEEFSVAFDLGDGQALDTLLYGTAARHGQAVPGPQAATELVVASLRKRRGIEDEMLRIKRAADHAPSMIFQLMQMPDGSCHFPYTSEAIRRMYGITSQQASESAERLLCFLGDKTRAEMSRALAEAARAGVDWHAVFEVVRPDSPPRWHEAMATPRHLANGVILWHGHSADVTERRELEAAVADKRELERQHQVRSEFMARVSHELRTPLNGILGFAQLLAADRSENLSAQQRERLGLLTSSGRHLLALVSEVLEVTSIDAGHLKIDLQTLELAPLLQRALQGLQEEAAQARVLILPTDCAEGLLVCSNAQRLHQVLLNLLSNAIKYNRPSGTVQLAARQVEHGVRLDVIDTGQGMSADQQASLFQPFNRLGAEKTTVPGNGLGLVISKQLLGLMEASLRVRSEQGSGSTFSVLLREGQGLPADPSDAAPQKAVVEVVAAVQPPDLPSTSGNVLYVEDDEVNTILMTAVLGMRPRVRLKVAVTGAEAIRVAREQVPDLLLIDMHLPDTNGIELLVALRGVDGLQTVPAVMVSAGARQQDIARALSSGFGGYWTKPLDIDKTLASIDEILGRGVDFKG